MKKILFGAVGGILILLGLAFSDEIGKLVFRGAVEFYKTAAGEEAVEKLQEKTATKMRDQLPMNIDEITVWQDVVSKGKTLTYYYKILVRRENIDIKNFNSAVWRYIISNVCGRTSARFVLSIGGRYSFVYVDPFGAVIKEFTVLEEDCK